MKENKDAEKDLNATRTDSVTKRDTHTAGRAGMGDGGALYRDRALKTYS